MALAEARTAWQRTANRCWVQEDAKRAPRLACYPSAPPSFVQAEIDSTNVPDAQDIPNPSTPYNQNLPCYNLSPSSKWWLQMPPVYGYQKGLIDEQFRSLGGKDGSGELSNEGHYSCKGSTKSCDNYFESDLSWIASGKNTSWWRAGEAVELDSLGSKKSLHLIENCDLPRPQHPNFRKGLNSMCYPTHAEIYASSLDQRSGIRDPHHLRTCDSTPFSLSASCSLGELRMPVGDQSLSGTDQPLRYRTTHKRMAEMHAIEDDTGKAKLLEALRHSQTRAREAEDVAKQACAEKDHIIKLIIRQASQIFAYKQWIQLLQLENMYFQLRVSKSESASTAIPVMIPLRTQKDPEKPRSRKKVKRGMFYGIGLGLIGAGLLLGWTIGWMLPTWWW